MFGEDINGGGKKSMNKIMKFMMMSEMMKGFGGNPQNNAMANMMPLMMMSGGNMGDLFSGIFDFGDEERAAAERAKIAAQADADKAIIAANADLEVVKVQAEAALYAGEREAEMNQRISKSLTNELVSYYWIKQWNGELPTTVLSEDGNYMIALNTEDAK